MNIEDKVPPRPKCFFNGKVHYRTQELDKMYCCVDATDCSYYKIEDKKAYCKYEGKYKESNDIMDSDLE